MPQKRSCSQSPNPSRGRGRWLALLIAGSMLFGMGLAFWLVGRFAPEGTDPNQQPVWTMARVSVLIVAGAIFAAIALLQFHRASPTRDEPKPSAPLDDIEPTHSTWQPAIVVVGGGHGLSTLLRGLKAYTTHLTGIVTVAEDGGSSGALRRGTGMLPPGDLRRCIAALSEAEPLLTQLFEYRFGGGAGLDGHAFGNLFIAALAQLTGDFVSGVAAASRVLAVNGRILPSSLDNVALWAEVESDDGPALLQGQSRIARSSGRVERVYLRPQDAKGYPDAVQALLQADMIVLGPGSLYTSILPNLLVEEIRAAIGASSALKVYVCNVATQPGETDGYDVRDHVHALEEHLGAGFCDCVLANGQFEVALPNAASQLVPLGQGELPECRLILGDLVDRQRPWRHDADKLAQTLLSLGQEHRTQTQRVNPDAPGESIG